MGAARMVGDTSLYKKMEQAEQDIKRDIVFAASLVSRNTSFFDRRITDVSPFYFFFSIFKLLHFD